MDLKTKLYQMFILGLEGDGYRNALRAGLGGIIFFSENIQSVKQFKLMVSEIKQQAKIPPFLSIDQEGGRVERTGNIHKGRYLSAKYAYKKGENFLAKQTEEIAHELSEYGINLNFAPCIDVNTNPNNPVIGERAFSNITAEVINGERIVSNVYRKNNIIPCVKHFPGHGDTSKDSHLTLPKVDMDFNTYEQVHIRPFKEAIAGGIEMIMAAHLHVPFFEKECIPISLSKNAVNYLRHKLKFNGIIISDDMVMKGVAGFGAAEACEKAIRAGLNMLIYRNSSEETVNIIDTIAQKAENDIELKNNIEKSYELIIKLKQEKHII